MKKLFIILFIFASLPAHTQQKFALVIGNANYGDFGVLQNPLNDANDMADVLQSLGFTVNKVLDGDLRQMETAVNSFRERLKAAGNNSYGMFYYAGHAVQMDSENFLIPVDASIPDSFSLRLRALSVQVVLNQLNSAGNKLNIVVLDACRDFPASWNRSANRGLAVVSPPADSIIVYSTSAGSVAADGTGRNGLFTEHLLNNLKIPGLDVKEIFNLTGADVARASNRTQIPAIYSQFFESAVLLPHPPAVPRNVRINGTPGIDSVSLIWDSAGAGLNYRVYYNTQNDPSGASVYRSPVNGTMLNLTGLNGGTFYYFWVSSMIGGLESGKSAVITAQTLAPVPRQQPVQQQPAQQQPVQQPAQQQPVQQPAQQPAQQPPAISIQNPSAYAAAPQSRKARFGFLGMSIGSAFSVPRVILTAQAALSPFNNSFIEAGLDLGLSSKYPSKSYYSLLPYMHVNFYLPFPGSGVGGIYAGAGAGFMFAIYTFSTDSNEYIYLKNEKAVYRVFTGNAIIGINILDSINVSYTLRTNFSVFNSKLSVGYILRSL